MRPPDRHARPRHRLRVAATAVAAAGALLASAGTAGAAGLGHGAPASAHPATRRSTARPSPRHQVDGTVRRMSDPTGSVSALALPTGTSTPSDAAEKSLAAQSTTRQGTTGQSTTTTTTAATGPMLGILGVSGDYYSVEAQAGVKSVTIQLGWVLAETGDGTFSSSYLAAADSAVQAAYAAGMKVVIDPGIQYAPSWVYDLGGGTQFVDQYGDVFTGAVGSGDDVANAVTDTAVRDALGGYLAELGRTLDVADITAVRQGGGPTGEIRYPDADYDGHTDCYWAYDTSSQALSPNLDYTPGTGTAAEATAFLDQYNDDLDGFADWMNAQLETDFATTILVMLPGWGQRPGVAAEEEADLLDIPYDEFNQGLDWAQLLPSLPDQADSVAYTTYLDAPSYQNTPQEESPALYIASLAGPLGMRLGGENTGNGTVASLQTCLTTAESLGYWLVNWMDESQLVASTEGIDPLGPTITDLALAARADLGS